MDEDQVVDVWDAMEVLQIRRGMTWAQACSAYRASVRVAHPDRGGDDEVFRLVSNAWAAIQPYRVGDQLVVPEPPTPPAAAPATTPSPAPTPHPVAPAAAGKPKKRHWWQPEVYTGPPPRRAQQPTTHATSAKDPA